MNEVERAYFGYRRPAYGNRLLESAAARTRVKLPPLSPMQGAADGISLFVFTHLSVTTMSVTDAKRMAERYHIRPVMRPLADLDPTRCSKVILIATH
ncbi:MAG: hypothetical protein ACYDEV_04325 [Acidiferrobacter sp.]